MRCVTEEHNSQSVLKRERVSLTVETTAMGIEGKKKKKKNKMVRCCAKLMRNEVQTDLKRISSVENNGRAGKEKLMSAYELQTHISKSDCFSHFRRNVEMLKRVTAYWKMLYEAHCFFPGELFTRELFS